MHQKRCRMLSYHSRNSHPTAGQGAVPAPRRAPPRQYGSPLSPTQGLGERALLASPMLRPQSLTFCLAPDILLAAPVQEQIQNKKWQQEELPPRAGTGGGQAPPAALWLASMGNGHSFSHDTQRWVVKVRGKFLLTLT